MANQLTVRSIAELRGECPLYRGVGVNQHRWVTDVSFDQEYAEIRFYVGREGWDPIAPQADAEDVFCRYCDILAVK